MSVPSSFRGADVHDPRGLREAGAEWLSLALMDARNRTLRWLSAFEGFTPGEALAGFDPPAFTIGHAAWFQEAWISRLVQRGRGPAADPGGPRLASIEPQADGWFAPGACTPLERWVRVADYQDGLRSYLAATLDTTLELLDKASPEPAGLYFFRLALLHEDRSAETLAALARAVGLPLPDDAHLLPVPPPRPRRDALGFGAQTVCLGTPGGAFAPDNERPAFEVAVPEFEIDAQPVCWSQFAEFAADGGYDEPRWWSPEGWDWVEATQRRAPRYVEQFTGGVLVHAGGRAQRVPGGQSALHVAWFEADAWCRWAGRRLPTEAEWALAVSVAGPRGFAWGDGFEWVAGTARPWPGQVDGPARLDALPARPGGRVMRGASAATVPRLRHPGARRFAAGARDELFSGFRSCVW
ncbi:SUMF1/EgtB/PvdO family nonheme iron enzyme [Ideonella sp. A 288]|uniref:SUMF1/EgtB/PvdO family nonheme iron enzyme n=1 Tax=Ideonella sp. A 288 TaxID=1962181 RepID=UPI000B4BADBC|nr:SUMF1/EgtB/PvdO family nonheme iron enzyme [Ideonella sp. A 288]